MFKNSHSYADLVLMLFNRTPVYKIKKYLQNILLILCVLFISRTLPAAPATVTFQARIVKPDLTNLESSNVSFKFYYLYPKPGGADLQCVIYAEEINGVNMTGSKGLVTLQLGSGTRTYGSGNLKNVFDNSTASYTCQAGGTYVPAANDNRRVIVQFNDGTGVQTLPASELTAVPYAMQSYNTQRLGNSLATDFLKFTDFTGTCGAGEYLKYDSSSSPKFSCAIPIGTGAGIVMSVAPGTGPLLVGGTATDPTISIPKASASADGYLSSADFTTFNSKLSNLSSLTSSDITGKLGFTPAANNDSRFTDTRTPTDGSVTAAKIASATITFDKFNQSSAISGQVIKWNGSAWVASADDTGVGAVTSVAGRTGVVTLSSGDISGLAFGTTVGTYAQGNDSRFSDQRNPINDSVTSAKILDGTITAADLSSMDASVGQVMKWNGSSWVASNDNTGGGGSVTNVSASGPLSSTGGGTPNITIAKATASVDGYLSSADFTTFAAKLSDFSSLLSSDITSKLGYTPVNPATAVTSVAGRTGVVTLSSGDISGLAFGTTAGTYAQGNDSRFIDTRTPTDNTVTSAKILDGTIASADISDASIEASKLAQMGASAGQVMKWNGSAWVASSDNTGAGGSVTNVSASGPLSSSGGATPNITLSQASGSTDGYLSSADFTIFNSKLSNFSTLLSSDITGKLGYTPVNPSSLGTAALLNSGDVVLVSNMPANCSAGQTLTFSSPTGSWVCSSIVLGNSTVTNAMITSLDWTKVVNTPTTAAGYGIPKATAGVDGYLSSADFTIFNSKLSNFVTMTSSDITTALGYTAAKSSDVSGKVSKSGDTMTGSLNLPSNGLAVGTNELTVSGGKVGVGTASPDSPLTINSNATGLTSLTGYAGTSVHIVGADGSKARVMLDGIGSAGPPIFSLRASRGTLASPAAMQAGDELGEIGASGYAATVYASGGKSRIMFNAAENWTDTSTASNTVFETTPSGSTTQLERMRIESTGNIGIGTASPSATLDVKGNFAISGATSGAVKFAVQAAAGSATYTWPAAAPGSNMVLQSDTSGNLSWVAAATGNALTANPLSQFAATTSAQLLGVLSDETGTGAAVFGTSPTIATPTITTSAVVPMLIGGTGTTSTLTYKTTTGVGTTGADHIFQVGNNGATEAMRILNNGNVGIGTTSPGSTLDVQGVTAKINLLSTTVGNQALVKINNGTNTSVMGTENAVGGTVVTNSIANSTIVGSLSPYPLQLVSFGNVRATIDSLGNFGIGTTSPTAPFHTYVGSSTSANFTGVLHQVTKTSSTAAVNKIGMNIESTGTWDGAGAVNTGLVVNATGGTTNYAATFNGGNVGIGTALPAQKLEVAGSVNVGSQVTRTTASTDRGQLAQGSTFVKTSAGTTTLDANNGNQQEVINFVCNSSNTITFSNMRDGGAYTVLLSGTAAHSGTCLFAHSGLTFKTSGGNVAPTASRDVLFTFTVIGTTVIYSMMDNLQ